MLVSSINKWININKFNSTNKLINELVHLHTIYVKILTLTTISITYFLKNQSYIHDLSSSFVFNSKWNGWQFITWDNMLFNHLDIKLCSLFNFWIISRTCPISIKNIYFTSLNFQCENYSIFNNLLHHRSKHDKMISLVLIKGFQIVLRAWPKVLWFGRSH